MFLVRQVRQRKCRQIACSPRAPSGERTGRSQDSSLIKESIQLWQRMGTSTDNAFSHLFYFIFYSFTLNLVASEALASLSGLTLAPGKTG